MIRAVERALAIFDAFDPAHTMLTLQEIGQRIGLSKATTYRLVNCLYDLGYLVRLDDNRYCLSLKLTRLSGMVRSTIGIREIARPIMLNLVQKTGRNRHTQYGLQRSAALHRGVRYTGAVDEHRACGRADDVALRRDGKNPSCLFEQF